MLKYDRNDLSEGIDIKKINNSCECITCHYWYFLEINFKFQPKVCNGYHDLMQKAMSSNDFAISFVKRNDYRTDFGI